MTDAPIVIQEENLSVAWAKTFLETMQHSKGEISPFTVIVTGFDDGVVREDSMIRAGLSRSLSAIGKPAITTISSTIFPESLWIPDSDRKLLYSRFLKIWPRVKKCKTNRLGHYFHRLIAFGDSHNPCNQLEHIINTWQRGNHRRSALQASIFDPAKDHSNNRQRGFPCLQHVVFSPLGTNGQDGLSVIGFYAVQDIYEKAYANYLGLSRLGRFMAREMGLTLVKMVCMASVIRLGDENSKSSLASVKDELENLIEPTSSIVSSDSSSYSKGNNLYL